MYNVYENDIERERQVYRLIVVDDEKIIRESIFAFEWQEINVKPVGCFADGQTALEYMSKNSVDVVLADICMPIMDGIEFIERIKNENYNVAVICISGYSDYEYLRACMRAGANDYILKPVDKQELIKTVEYTLQGKKVERMDFSEFDSDEEMNSENKKYHHYIEVAMDYIEENYSSYITLEHVAEEVYLNPVYLSHLFKKVTGVKFSEYLNDFRVKKATELLENSTLRIGEISTKVGYKDSRYFSEMFKKRMGLTPNEYRNKNEK